jgi:MFS family permease
MAPCRRPTGCLHWHARSCRLIQATLAGKLIARIGFRHNFMLTPITLLIGLGLMACFHGIAPIAVGLYLLDAVFDIEEPAGHAFLAQTPPDLRRRVSALLEGCFAPAGYILGCLLIVLSRSLAGFLPTFHAASHAFSLLLATIGAVVGLWASLQLSRCTPGSRFSQRYE